MSVILDVLKKLDREKSSHRSAAANIALEILKSDPPRSPDRHSLYLAAIVLTALATAAATYTLMGFGVMNPPATRQETSQAPHRPDPLSAPSPLPVKATPALNSQAAPAQPPTDRAEGPPRSGHRVTPARLAPEKPKDPPAQRQQAKPDSPPPETGRETGKETSRVPPETRVPAESQMTAIVPAEKEASPSPPQAAAERAAVDPPSLKISAIIWYDDPSRRFAMINDTMIREGSLIEEVKVEEIFPNRVRFSHHGRHFEISVK